MFLNSKYRLLLITYFHFPFLGEKVNLKYLIKKFYVWLDALYPNDNAEFLFHLQF